MNEPDELPAAAPSQRLTILRHWWPVLAQLLGVALIAVGFGVLAVWAGLAVAGFGLLAIGTVAEMTSD